MKGIEKRLHRRIDYKLKANVTYDSKHAQGIIENFSEEGIFKVVFSEKGVINFYPGEIIVINFTIPSGQELELECEMKWVRIQRGSPLFLKYSMGVKIINPPRVYKDFIKTLLVESVTVA
ncbi:PilZ domain-containing protein [bacterium]|nr:MAG: PilZ domain-containing protein [bacterium]